MARILICDDATFMRNMQKEILKDSEYEIVGEAVNGVEAIEKYKELKPDLLLLDITMPEMDGITALKEIMKIDSQAKVIMCSAMGQKTQVIEALECGAKAFVVKPYQPKELLENIKKVL